MKNLFLIAFLILSGNTAGAQVPKLPAGYSLQNNASGEPNILRYDFDGDGKADVFCAIEKEGEDAKLMAMLKNGKLVRSSQALAICCGSMSQRNGVIDVHSKGMRGFSYYRFRWEAAAQDFRLIGYDTESFGNAANDGSGTSSLNLLTGTYQNAFNSYNEKKQVLVALPRVKRKVPVSRRIYLKSFNEDADNWLAELNAKYLPKEIW